MFFCHFFLNVIGVKVCASGEFSILLLFQTFLQITSYFSSLVKPWPSQEASYGLPCH